jgi:4-coumarate--CoA ligase
VQPAQLRSSSFWSLAISFCCNFEAKGVQTPLNNALQPMYGAMEICKQLDDCKAKLIFTVEPLVPLLEKAKINLPIVCFGPAPSGTTSFSELIEADISKAPTVYIHPEDTLALPYSSGTTGKRSSFESRGCF